VTPYCFDSRTEATSGGIGALSEVQSIYARFGPSPPPQRNDFTRQVSYRGS